MVAFIEILEKYFCEDKLLKSQCFLCHLILDEFRNTF